jgi:hypothetical protein
LSARTILAEKYRAEKLDMRRLPPKYDPAAMSQSDEETNEPLLADHRNFYKVEKWTKDGSKVDHMLYPSSNLEKAREVFAAAIKHRSRIRLTIRQRTQVLEQWPASAPELRRFAEFLLHRVVTIAAKLRTWASSNHQTTVVLARRSFRRSILFPVAACAARWRRPQPVDLQPRLTDRSLWNRQLLPQRLASDFPIHSAPRGKILRLPLLQACRSGYNHTSARTFDHLNYGLQHFCGVRKICHSLLKTIETCLAVNLDQLVLCQVHDRIGRARSLRSGRHALV